MVKSVLSLVNIFIEILNTQSQKTDNIHTSVAAISRFLQILFNLCICLNFLKKCTKNMIWGDSRYKVEKREKKQRSSSPQRNSLSG